MYVELNNASLQLLPPHSSIQILCMWRVLRGYCVQQAAPGPRGSLRSGLGATNIGQKRRVIHLMDHIRSPCI